MFTRYTLTGLICAFLLTSADASAQLFRRRAVSAHYTTMVYPCPSSDCSPVTPATTSQNAVALSEDDTAQLAEMIQKLAAGEGFQSNEEAEAYVAKYKNGTDEQRKAMHEEFKKETAPPTEEEVARFAEMVKEGAVTASQISYLSLTVTNRKKAYDAFKKAFLPKLTTEEMSQFLEMAKDKKTGQYDLSGLPTFQKLTLAQRKLVYEAFKSQK